jgi:NAD(P)-dependent dehydrogenase (short-subunit alcohol dehydrogenase family)
MTGATPPIERSAHEGRPNRAVVAPVERMRWRLVPAPDQGAGPSPDLAGKRIAVINGAAETAALVAATLRAAGAVASVVHGAFPAIVPDAVVDLTLAGPFVAGTTPDYRGALARSVAAIDASYATWAAEHSAIRIGYLAVTYLGGDMGYGDGSVVQPLGGIWAGLAKTLHREIPNCNTRIVDVGADAMAALPGIIRDELYRWGLFEIGYVDGRRFTLMPVREHVPAPRIELGPSDTVLVSGGGRGIGFRLARGLAEDFGCRVVVTGRQPLPTDAEPWFGLDDAEFSAFERTLWADRADGRPLARIRARIAAVRSERELAENVLGARRNGLRIDYRRCDFTDPAQISALVAELGDELTGIVHNAGVDTPRRLPDKSGAEFLHTVGTKVDSFLSLFDLVADRKLKFFCNVGSLTGRLGGMVGQLDYAAANEGLARLGLWARRRVDFPVMTLCWPTWDRLGMVANFAATLRYMAALDVDEGVHRWQRELLAGSSGEICFVGPLGQALGPIQAKGYPAAPDLPGFTQLYPRIFHLGDVLTNEPHTTQTTVVTLHTSFALALGDFLVDGAPALPISLLIEDAIQAAAWLVPSDYPDLRLDVIRDISVRPAGLVLGGQTLRLRRTVTGGYVNGRWTVAVRYHDVASMCLVYTSGEPVQEIEVDPPDAEPAGNRPALCWRGLVLPLAAVGTDGEITEAPAADLWALPIVPASLLPLTAVENVLRATALRTGTGESLTIAGITVHTAPGPTTARTRVEGDPVRGDWRVYDSAGRPLLHVRRPRFRAQEPNQATRNRLTEPTPC